jgi:pyruvate formate lyase activating enzyme
MPHDQDRITGRNVDPSAIVEEAERLGCRSIAFTYTEPTIYLEYARDIARLGRDRGLKGVFVTNGYLTEEALMAIQPHLDAASVDLKAFREVTYRRHIGGRLEPILDTLRRMRRLGIWLEVTTLVVPGVNSDSEELADMAGFIAGELGEETPWHLSAFHPSYRMADVPPTKACTLERVVDIGREAGLHYVYVGNVPGHHHQDTFCPSCGRVLIVRRGFGVASDGIAGGSCSGCGMSIPGVGL